MNYLAIKDLKAPKRVRETLAEYGTALITNNGKPMAMLVDLLEGESPEALSDAILDGFCQPVVNDAMLKALLLPRPSLAEATTTLHEVLRPFRQFLSPASSSGSP